MAPFVIMGMSILDWEWQVKDSGIGQVVFKKYHKYNMMILYCLR